MKTGLVKTEIATPLRLRLDSGPVPRRIPPERPGPEGGRRDENRKYRTQLLCSSAMELFLEQGIDAITIDEIVDKAGVAKGSFYRYFEDKADLVEALFDPLRAVYEAAITGCKTRLEQAVGMPALFAAYEDLAGDLGKAVVDNPQLILLYLQERRAPAVGARASVRRLADWLGERSIELTEIAHKKGMLRTIPASLSGLALVGAIEQLMFELLSGRDLGNPLEIGTWVVELFMRGLEKKDNQRIHKQHS